MNVSTTAYLCGYFTAQGVPSLPEGWEPVVDSEEHCELLRNFYFPGFVDLHTRAVKKYVRPVGERIDIPLPSGQGQAFRVEELRLWMMPCSLVICAVKTVFEDTPVDQVTACLNTLRNCSFYADAPVDAWIETAIGPLDQAYRSLGGKSTCDNGHYTHLVENGNKFKVFQIVTSAQCPEEGADRDRLLYAAGTFSRYEAEPPYSTDRRYFDKLMENHRLGVFSSWTALALLDSVTFLSKELSPFQRNIWENDYFGMLYVYELFRKCFLYHHNWLFRTGAKDPAVLLDELDSFERKYTFTAISYNFLPVDVDNAIARGLALEKEENSLGKLVAREAASREQQSSSKRDRFLLFLTCLASLSAVWDISCLLDEVINYENAFHVANWGYRLFSSLLLVLIVIVAWRSNPRPRKK